MIKLIISSFLLIVFGFNCVAENIQINTPERLAVSDTELSELEKEFVDIPSDGSESELSKDDISAFDYLKKERKRIQTKEKVQTYIQIFIAFIILLATLISFKQVKQIKHNGWKRLLIVISLIAGSFSGTILYFKGNTPLIPALILTLISVISTVIIILVCTALINWIRDGFKTQKDR